VPLEELLAQQNAEIQVPPTSRGTVDLSTIAPTTMVQARADRAKAAVLKLLVRPEQLGQLELMLQGG